MLTHEISKIEDMNNDYAVVSLDASFSIMIV